jgi:hypothetical protein
MKKLKQFLIEIKNEMVIKIIAEIIFVPATKFFSSLSWLWVSIIGIISWIIYSAIKVVKRWDKEEKLEREIIHIATVIKNRFDESLRDSPIPKQAYMSSALQNRLDEIIKEVQGTKFPHKSWNELQIIAKEKSLAGLDIGHSGGEPA